MPTETCEKEGAKGKRRGTFRSGTNSPLTTTQGGGPKQLRWRRERKEEGRERGEFDSGGDKLYQKKRDSAYEHRDDRLAL